MREIKPIRILMAEDNPADVDLTREVLKDAKVTNELFVVEDGVKAMAFLRREGDYADAPRPDIILLDLGMPRKDGLEVLEEVKADDNLKRIPVVILTTSEDEKNILQAYNHHVNCYITKPVDFDQFTRVVKFIEDFWFTVVTLPPE